MTAAAVALGAIIFGAFATQAMTGFGSVILSLTLGALLFPVAEILPVVVALSLLLASYMAIRHRRHIDGRLLLTSVVPLMGVGLVAGRVASHALDASALERLLGVVVVASAVRGLWECLGRSSIGKPIPSAARWAWILAAGIIHGLFATGGPPLVYALGRSSLDKSAMRSTLACVWLVLNAALTASFIGTGTFGADEATRVLAYVPVVALAIAVGERLHARVSERRFRTVVFALVLVAGLMLALS